MTSQSNRHCICVCDVSTFSFFSSLVQFGVVMITACANLLRLKAEDLMSCEVIRLHQEMSIKEASLILVKNGISGAPVVDAEGRCIGVFSTTDLLRSYSNGTNRRTIPLEREVTCPFVHTMQDAGGRQTSLCGLPLGVCAIQRHHKDASGKDVVMCSEPHAVPVEWGILEIEKLPNDPIQCYMTVDPVMVDSHAHIRDVARMMVDAHIHRIIVINEDRQPVGILSSTDLLSAIAFVSEV
jgi:CBS domain-containing protein